MSRSASLCGWLGLSLAIAALKWPAMTMTFKAPDVDLASLKHGDHVEFEFTSTGMDGTITKINRQ